jgi:bifunctional UDP-N-acetylglucosamine pyrophosphorylase/glucosamine-1-phosphate N-acetyltransferase
MASSLDVVILAAGQGKRMHSDVPKALHRIAGRPLASHVLATLRTLSPRTIALVVGYGADAVEHELAAPDVVFVRQDPLRCPRTASRWWAWATSR